MRQHDVAVRIACLELAHELGLDESHAVELIAQRDPVGLHVVRPTEELHFAHARRQALDYAVDLVGLVRGGAHLRHNDVAINAFVCLDYILISVVAVKLLLSAK